MTVEELLQKLVELAREGRGQYMVTTPSDTADYPLTEVEADDVLKLVSIF